jgi:KDO2-lipid IV(A) lauroyltransferase
MRATFVRLLLRLFALLPLRVAHAVGGALGWLAYVIPNDLRRVTLVNLAHCLPELDERARRRLARRSLMETGKTVTELGAIWFWSPKRVAALVGKVIDEDVFRSAIGEGKGVILVTPHLGAWEMNSLHFGQSYPLTALYRPPRMQELDDLVRVSRERMGSRLVPTTASGVKALYKALDKGEVIGILPDQDPGKGGGVFAPFFGVAANSMILLPRLAQKTGAPVIFIYAERLAKGRGYNIHVHRASNHIYDADLAVSATAMNAAVEACVREVPEQYQWSYKRFKTRPKGEPKLY